MKQLPFIVCVAFSLVLALLAAWAAATWPKGQALPPLSFNERWQPASDLPPMRVLPLLKAKDRFPASGVWYCGIGCRYV